MNTVTQIIEHVIHADLSTPGGKEHAKQAVEKLCDQIGATRFQKQVVSDALFSGHARPRVTLSNVRLMLGGISRQTLWRWRKTDRFGLGSIDVLEINSTNSETYLDQVLEVMKRKSEEEKR